MLRLCCVAGLYTFNRRMNGPFCCHVLTSLRISNFWKVWNCSWNSDEITADVLFFSFWELHLHLPASSAPWRYISSPPWRRRISLCTIFGIDFFAFDPFRSFKSQKHASFKDFHFFSPNTLLAFDFFAPFLALGFTGATEGKEVRGIFFCFVISFSPPSFGVRRFFYFRYLLCI